METTRPEPHPKVDSPAGETLAARLVVQRFTEGEVLKIADEALVLLAADHAHRPPRLHRALTPAHFLRTPNGALRLLSDAEADPDQRGYVAPERLSGLADPRSDLHGLGATLVQLLTGVSPAGPLASRASLRQALGPLVSSSTAAFLQRLAAVRIEDRFGSASEALAELRGRRKPRRGARIGMAASAVIAIAFGLFAWRSSMRTPEALVPAIVDTRPTPPAADTRKREVVPEPETELIEPAEVPPAVAAASSFDELPPAGEVRFSWIEAHWGRGVSGPWLLDETGQRHHAKMTGPGCTTETFLKCNGAAEGHVADGPGFAISGPFSIDVHLELSSTPLTRTAELIRRGAPDGRFAWSLEVSPEYELIYKISDGAGHVSTVKGQLERPNPRSNGSFNVYAMFDPKTGDQWLLKGCEEIGRTKTALRPAKQLKGADVTLLRGFSGLILDFTIQHGLWERSGTQGCSMSLTRMNER